MIMPLVEKQTQKTKQKKFFKKQKNKTKQKLRERKVGEHSVPFGTQRSFSCGGS